MGDSYHVIKRPDGWAIRREWRTHRIVPVGCLVPGSLQYGHADQPGAFCTRHLPESELYDTHGQDLLGFYKTKAAAERMIERLERKARKGK